MLCPVCGGAMRRTDRNTVLFEECLNCGGAWFEAAELERLVGAARREVYADTRLRDRDAPYEPTHARARHADSDSDDGYGREPRHGRRGRGFLQNLMGMFD